MARSAGGEGLWLVESVATFRLPFHEKVDNALIGTPTKFLGM